MMQRFYLKSAEDGRVRGCFATAESAQEEERFLEYVCYVRRSPDGRWERGVLGVAPEQVWSWAEDEPLTCLCSQCGKTPRNQHLMLALCDECNFDQDDFGEGAWDADEEEDRGYQQCRQCGGTAIDGTVCTYCRETLSERYDEEDDGSAEHHAREEVVAISYADIPF